MAMRLIIMLILTAWFILAVVLGLQGIFEVSPDRPPLGTLIALNVPLLLFAVLYLVSVNFRDFVLELDLALITDLQTWRIVGVMFLVLYYHELCAG